MNVLTPCLSRESRQVAVPHADAEADGKAISDSSSKESSGTKG